MSNITKKRLKDSPFKTATEESKFIKRIKSSELERLIRIQTRQNYFEAHKEVLAPFHKGQKVEFTINKTQNSLHTYLSGDGTVIHNIDSSFQNEESGELVKSLLEAIGGVFTRSYLESLGLLEANNNQSE